MELTFENTDGVMVLTLRGRLDAATSPEAESGIAGRIDSASAWLVDLEEVDYVSSAGLRVLLLLAKKLQQKGGKLALCRLTSGVREVFDISGFSLIFKIYPDCESALESLR